MNRDVIRQVVNVVALAITLIINFLSNALPINGQTAADISNRLPILFVPANYVFGIWGIIYVLLIGFAVYQALPAQRENPRLRRIGYWFVLSCAANSIWLLFFHYNLFPLSMVAMLVLLGSLIIIYRMLHHDPAATSNAERIWVKGTFSVYLGWITVATVANASYVLYDAGWNGFGLSDATWAIIMLIVATGITAYMVWRYQDAAYSAVIVWAFVGIVIKQANVQIVAFTAILMIAAIVGVLAFVYIGRNTPTRTPLTA